jgi:hypothetical protein
MEIRNECADIQKRVEGHVWRSLSFIYPPDLVGISFVRLVDKAPIDVKLYLKQGHKKNDVTDSSYAFYKPAQQKDAAYVALIVPEILRDIPHRLMWTPAPTLLFAHAIAHEVGHHLISQRGYALHPSEVPRERSSDYEEEMVNRYAFEVVRKMKMQWRYKIGQRVIEEIARWWNIQGQLAWEKKRYKRSKEYFLRAFHLNPEDANYRECYRIAHAKLEKESQAKSKS